MLCRNCVEDHPDLLPLDVPQMRRRQKLNCPLASACASLSVSGAYGPVAPEKRTVMERLSCNMGSSEAFPQSPPGLPGGSSRLLSAARQDNDGDNEHGDGSYTPFVAPISRVPGQTCWIPSR